MPHSVLLFILVSYSSTSWHTTWFSLAVRRSFLKELRLLMKTAKYIWTTCEIYLAKLSSMQIFLRTWQGHWFVNNPAQFPAQSKFFFYFPAIRPQNHSMIYFFLHLTRKLTNLEVRYLIQVTESRSEYFSRCKKQVAFFNKLPVQKSFRI